MWDFSRGRTAMVCSNGFSFRKVPQGSKFISCSYFAQDINTCVLEASSSEEGKTHFGNMNNLSQASSEFSIRTDLKADEQRQGVPLQGQIVKQDGGADTLPQSTVGPDWVQ